MPLLVKLLPEDLHSWYTGSTNLSGVQLSRGQQPQRTCLKSHNIPDRYWQSGSLPQKRHIPELHEDEGSCRFARAYAHCISVALWLMLLT